MMRLGCETDDYNYGLDHPELSYIKNQTAMQSSMIDLLVNIDENIAKEE